MASNDRFSSDRFHAEIRSPDWKTFEDIEEYIQNGPTGILGSLLPELIWNYLFAPTTADREAVRRYRAVGVGALEPIFDAHRDARQSLRSKALPNITEDAISIEDILQNAETAHYPASAPQRSYYSSVEERIADIEIALERESQLLQEVEVLSSEPHSAFFYTSERAQLAEAKVLLSESVETGTDNLQILERTRNEVISSLESRIKKWDDELDVLRREAEPYLNYTAYLSEDGLLSRARTVADELDSFRNSMNVTEVSHPSVDQFLHLESSIMSFIEDLEHSRITFAKQEAEKTKQAADEEMKAIKLELKSARRYGASIELPNTLRMWVTSVQQPIDERLQGPCVRFLPQEQVNEILTIKKELCSIESFIEEKISFDTYIGDYEESVEELERRTQPYFEYDLYLTRPARDEIIQRTKKTERDLVASVRQTDVAVLGKRDRQRLITLRNRLRHIREHLKDYNKEFVTRQRKICTPLFEDIGSSNLSLTAEQQCAVIRNGSYNQIIAAAGTGKTLTLTTRIAYLIYNRGIDPDRILAVTFTKKATDEMQTRLKEHFGIENVDVRTIHSFGRRVIQQARDERATVIEENQILNFIDQHLREARERADSEFSKHYYQFLVHFDDVYLDETSFETKEAYVEARAKQAYTTLRGEEVKSRAEKLIADFLFTHRVDYRYEELATWADGAPEKAMYSPDFYLPDYDVYIEHWGVNESGSVAPWFSWSSEQYQEKMAWARSEFERCAQTLVETFEYEHEKSPNTLKQALQQRLIAVGVELEQMEFDELIESAFEYDKREGWIKQQFQDFIKNAKRFDMEFDAIKASLTPLNPRQYHFGHCGLFLFQQYIRLLHEENLIDYVDMIHDAVELVRSGSVASQERYDHLLVDEFQDIGTGKLELIRELTGSNGAKLFAVGDDWQSIFSFQGAVVDYFVNFEDHFGPAVRTDLTRNFRSPPQVVDVGNHVISHNENQLDKQVSAEVAQETTPRLHFLQGYSFYDYVRRVRVYTIRLVQQYCQQGAEPSDIMVLCRFDGAVPYLHEIKNGLRSQGIPYVGKSDRYGGADRSSDDGVSVYSVHQAKGREAKHVILVHAAEGPFGFPSADRDSELLSPVQPVEMNTIEEERRLFYVALTRSKQTVDLLSREGKPSRFIEEIKDYLETVDAGKVEPLKETGEFMTVDVKVNKLLNPWTKQHQRGYLVDRYGGSARFVSWESSDPPTLDENQWYRLSRVRVGEYKDEKELVLTSHCEVCPLKDEHTVE